MQHLWSFTKEAMPFVGPFVSGLVAAFIIHLLTRARDREARKAERESLVIERRKEFQRETLLAVQDQAQKMISATGCGHRLDVIALNESGKTAAWPNDLTDAFSSARDQVKILAVRLRSKSVRQHLSTLQENCVLATHDFPTLENSKIAMRVANETFRLLNDQIGQELAALDTFEQIK